MVDLGIKRLGYANRKSKAEFKEVKQGNIGWERVKKFASDKWAERQAQRKSYNDMYNKELAKVRARKTRSDIRQKVQQKVYGAGTSPVRPGGALFGGGFQDNEGGERVRRMLGFK